MTTTATETTDRRDSSCTGRSRCSDFRLPKHDRVCQTCGAAIYQGVMCAACWSARAFPPKNPNVPVRRGTPSPQAECWQNE